MVLLWALLLFLVDLVDRPGLGTVDSFLGNPCRVFSLNGNLNSMGESQFCVRDLEDSFVVDRAYESLAQSFVLWVFDRREITGKS